MVGDFSPQDMLAQIEKVFGSWAAGAVEEAPDPALPELPARRVYLVHLPGSVQTQIVVGNRAITRKHPDWLRLDAGEFDLRRRVQFAPGDEYPRSRRATPTARAAARIPCASTVISASARRCATTWSPRR